jgi:hypothetical protein
MKKRSIKFDSYGEVYKVDAREAYVNGGFTEEGDQVYCVCGGEMGFNENENSWQCKDCGILMPRIKWFNEIDAHLVPGPKCLTQCGENYPLCKNWCLLYDIPDDDPIL